jgi:hypothetical protein
MECGSLTSGFDFSHHRYKIKKYLFALIAGIGLCSMTSTALGECTSTVQGAVAIDVLTCGVVNTNAFNSKQDKYKVFSDLDAAGKKQLIATYKGLAIKAVVAKSDAVRAGLDSAKGALQGETLTFFISPQANAQCKSIKGQRVIAQLNETCCDGTPAAPCLLNTGYVLKDLQVQGPAQIGPDGKAITQPKSQKITNQDYKTGEALFLKKDYKKSVEFYKKADNSGEIDIKGLYRWGFALRQLEECAAAVVPLKKIYDKMQAGKIWTEEETDSRRGIFLLARCHAKLNEASNAVFYLNGFLLDSKKYRPEIRQSLQHKDFGWIHTTKEYKEYMSSAREALKSR